MNRLWRAILGAKMTELETDHAEAVLDHEREVLRRQVAEYNRGLAGHAGLIQRSKSELVQLASERERLEPKLRARLAAADRETAGRYALRLEGITERRAQLEQQLEQAETTYRELTQARELAVGAARERIEALKRSIDECRLEEALAELTELASGLQGSIGAADPTLDRVKERLDERRHYAAGRVRVARESIDGAGIRANAAEQALLAEQALERFEAARKFEP